MDEVPGQETIWTEEQWADQAAVIARAKLASLLDENGETVDNSQEVQDIEATND